MPTTVYYHADCLDGFSAAYAAWRNFGARARYLPMHHGEDWAHADVADCDVYILDFSFPRDSLLALAGLARSLTLLDHHVTARQPWQGELQPAADGSERYRHPALPLELVFDMERSGARLTWEHFHPGVALPRALAHIEDIDLWRFRLPGTRPFCRALRMQPWDFAAWDTVVRDEGNYRQLLADGQAIDAFVNLEVQRLADSRLPTPIALKGEPIDPLQALRHGLPVIHEADRTWRAERGLAINASSLFASELGNLLAERHGGFALIWEMNDQQIAKASLRASGGVNVARIAENYGGGGHPNAAGFRLPLRQLLDLMDAK